jgi:hypothetical protein
MLRDNILLLRQDILIWHVNLNIPQGYAGEGFELGHKRGHETAWTPRGYATLELGWNR